MLEKTCTVCSASKPTDYFAKNKLGALGVSAWCKACFSAKAREKYRENPSPCIERTKQWNRDNAERTAARMRSYREERPEHFRKYVRDYRANNPEKRQAYDAKKRASRLAAIKAGGSSLTAGEWREIKNLYDHCCAYCFGAYDGLTIDHVVPLSRGGLHHRGNILPACRSCNASKGAKPLEDWRAFRIGCVQC